MRQRLRAPLPPLVRTVRLAVLKCKACAFEVDVYHTSQLRTECPACGWSYMAQDGHYERGVLRVEEHDV